jgi:hypothetical protein
VSNADVIDENGSPRLTVPMFELWLQSRGLTPTGGDYSERDDRCTRPSRHGARRLVTDLIQ